MRHLRFPRNLSGYAAFACLIGISLAFLLFQASNAAPPLASAFFALIRTAAANLLLFSGAAGMGMLLTKNVADRKLRIFISPLLGLILISTLALAAGLLHFIPGAGTWLLLAAVHLVFYRQIWSWVQTLRETAAPLFIPVPSRFTRFFRVTVLLLFLLALLIALAPPVQWDSLMYHLSAGRYYTDQGGIVASTHNYRFNNPALMAMLFMLLQNLADSSAPAVLNWILGVWTLLGVSVFFQCAGENPSAGLRKTWLTAGLLFSSNSIWIAMTRSYADMALLPLFLASIILLLPGEKAARRPSNLLAGLLCGALIAIKYTAFPFCIGTCLLALTAGDSWRDRLKSLLLVSTAAAFTALPWLLKNYLLDGNPIAPYIWGSPAFDAYDMAHTLPTPYGSPLLNLFVLPLQAAVYGNEFLDPFQGSIGPVLPGLFPAVFLSWKSLQESSRKLLTALLIALVPAYLTWAIGAGLSQNLAIVRFYLPMFMLMALMVTTRLGNFTSPGSTIPWPGIVRAGTVLALILGFVQSVFMLTYSNPLPVVLGLQDRDSYLESQLGQYYTLAMQVQSLAENDPDVRVLMLWEPRTFYCQPACTGDDNLNSWQKALDQEGSADAVLTRWGQQGITHVLISHRGAEFLLGQDLDRIPRLSSYDELLARIPDRLQPLQLYNDYGLYALK